MKNEINVLTNGDLDLTKGFHYDESTKKLTIDLSVLVDVAEFTIDPATKKLKINRNILSDINSEITSIKNRLDLLERG